MIWPTGAIGLDLSCPDGWHGFSESTSCYMWDNYDHDSWMRWWLVMPQENNQNDSCRLKWKIRKRINQSFPPPFCISHSNYDELMTMMTMKTMLKMMKVLKVMTITTRHTGFWMIISRAGMPVKNIAKTGEQVSCTLGFCVSVLWYLCVFVLWYFCVVVHWYFCVFWHFCAYVLWYFCLFVLR